MKTLTDLGLNKMCKAYINNLSHALYSLDGVEKRIDFFNKKVNGNIAEAFVFFDENYKGDISNIRCIDVEGDIVAIDNNIYPRTGDKALYIAFKHEFKEVEADV